MICAKAAGTTMTDEQSDASETSEMNESKEINETNETNEMAESSETGASKWDRAYMQRLLDTLTITSAECKQDGSIHLSCSAKGTTQVVALDKILLPDSSEHADFLSIVGPMHPGELKLFWDPRKEAFEKPSAEEIRAAVDSGHYRKVELLSDGALKVHVYEGATESYRYKIFFADTEQARAILDLTGPLALGVVHQFAGSVE